MIDKDVQELIDQMNKVFGKGSFDAMINTALSRLIKEINVGVYWEDALVKMDMNKIIEKIVLERFKEQEGCDVSEYQKD